MRKADENRAKKFIKNHERYKKWVAFAICLSLITGTGTLYMMNKPATALTEAGAESVGVVLETADSDYEQELIEETLENDEKDASEDASEESSEEASDEASSEESAGQGEDSAEDRDSSEKEESADKDSKEESEEGSEKSGEEKEDADADKKDGDSASKESGASDEDDVKADEKSGEDKDASDGDTEDKDSASRDKSDAEESGEKDEDETEDAASKKSSLKEDEEETEADEAGEKASGKDKKEAEEKSNKEKKTASSLGLSTVTREATDEEKLESLDVPKSVKVEDYVTEIIYERKLGDDKWEKIEKEDILEGDWIRVTYVYDIPKEATFADDITLDMADTTDIIDVEKVSVLDDAGDAEITDDGLISISFNDDTKQEILDKIDLEVSEVVDKDGNVLTEDEIEALESEDSEDESKDSEKDADEDESDAATESSDKDASNLQSRAFGLGGVVSLFKQGAISVLSVFEPLTVYADEGDEGTQTETYRTSAEGEANQNGATETKESIELDPQWITNVSAKLNPSTIWKDNQIIGYDPSTGVDLVNGQDVPDGALIQLIVDFKIPAHTLCDSKGNIITDTVTYDLNDLHGIKPRDDMSVKIYKRSGNKEEIGIATITKEGLVKLRFYESFVKGNSTEDILADFYFGSTAKANQDEEQSTITYTFNDNVSFYVVVKNNNYYDLWTTKTNGGVTDDGKVKYTIEVGSSADKHGSGGEVTLTDTFTVESQDGAAQGSFNSSDIKNIEVKKGGAVINPLSKKITEKGYILKLPKLEAGEKYTVEYTYVIPDEMKNSTKDTRILNKVIAETEKFGNKEGNSEAKIEGTITKESPDIKKTFVSYDDTNNEATWNIVINTKKANLNGYTLTDLVRTWNENNQNKYEYFNGKATITPKLNGNEGSEEIELKGENGYKFNGNNYNTYTITIVTPYSDYELVDGKKLYNNATIRKDNDHEFDSGEIPSVDIHKDSDISIEKKSDGYSISDSDITMKWTVTAATDIGTEILKDGRKCWVYIDEMEGYDHYITEDQLEKLKNELSSKKIEYSIEEGEKNTIWINSVEHHEYQSFKIFFFNSVESGFSFSYETTGQYKKSQDTIYTNKGYIFNKTISAEAKVEILQPKISKYDGNMKMTGTYNYDDDYLEGDGILTWIVELDIPDGKCGDLKIKELLPEDVTLLEENGICLSYTPEMTDFVDITSGSSTFNGVKFSFDKDNNIISFNSDSMQNRSLFFRIKARINDSVKGDDGAWVGGTVRKEFKNEVVLINKDNFDLQHAIQTTYVNKQSQNIEKGGIILNDNAEQMVKYYLDVNKGHVDLLKGGDVLTLRDSLTASYKEDCFEARLITDDIKIYEVSDDGNKTLLNSSEYSYTTSIGETQHANAINGDYNNQYAKFYTIEFKIPDKKHLKIEYAYVFSRTENRNTDIYNLGSIHAQNSAVLEGVSEDGSYSEISNYVEIKKMGASADLAGAEFYKVDYLDESKRLDGGEFSLWIYDKDNGYKRVKIDDKDTFTTVDGRFSFAELTKDTAYKIVEEVAPKGGYIKSDEPLYFMIESKAGSAKIQPKDFNGKVYTSGDAIILKNAKDKTSITVKKEWINADGTKSPIKVKLYKRSSKIASTYNYYQVNVYYEHNNELLAYRGFPSVREGSTLTYNLPVYASGGPTYVSVNGETTEYPQTNSSSTIITKEMTVNGNVNVYIKAPSQNGLNYSLSASVKTSGVADKETKVGEEQACEDTEQTLSDGNNWSYTYENLDKEYTENGNTYEWLYFVKEVSTNGYYTVEYSDNNKYGINSGTLTIVNTRNDVQGYILPKTGGIGDKPIKAAGIGFMGFAFVGSGVYFYKRRRKKAS